jgi:hypothetical protein
MLAFGLTNAPATFQSVMNRIFSRFIGKFVLVYLDDILIYSKTKEEHLEHLQVVMQEGTQAVCQVEKVFIHATMDFIFGTFDWSIRYQGR